MVRLRSVAVVGSVAVAAALTACASSVAENATTPSYFPSSPLPTPNLTQASGTPTAALAPLPSGPGQAGSSGLGTPASNVSATQALTFDPGTVTLKLGDVVEWKNTGNVPHNVTFDSQPSLSSGTLQQGDTWQVQFTQAGTYQYHCTFHPGMNGTVTVGG